MRLPQLPTTTTNLPSYFYTLAGYPFVARHYFRRTGEGSPVDWWAETWQIESGVAHDSLQGQLTRP